MFIGLPDPWVVKLESILIVTNILAILLLWKDISFFDKDITYYI
jgi:hypothetical protein